MANMTITGEEDYKQHQKAGDLPSGQCYVGMQFKKHFMLLWTDFRPDEKIEMTFPAVCLSSTSGFAQRGSGIACALTDKRLVMAQKAGLKRIEKSIRIETLVNVSISNKLTGDEIVVSTNTEQIVLKVSKKLSKRIYDAVQDSMQPRTPIAPSVVVQQIGTATEQRQPTADEVYRLKKLLDDGLISEEEFNTLKRRALGL